MNIGKQLRLKRVWKHKRAVIIPFDHGQYGGVPAGLEDPRKLVQRIAATKADAVLITPGVLQSVHADLGGLGVILRLDGAFTKYTPVAGDYETISSVEQAVRLGVDMGIVFTFIGTEFDAASLHRLGTTAEQSDAWGLPLISEVLAPSLLNNHFERDVFITKSHAGGVEEETVNIARIVVEHGADIVKTRYSGSVASFKKVVETCGAKVIVAGGPNTNKGDQALLQFAYDCVQAGASGIVFGRSVWQHPTVGKLIDALCAVVHDDATVENAQKLLR
jgi:DhnA family fructose-bisphosphate aldolase class Ia